MAVIVVLAGVAAKAIARVVVGCCRLLLGRLPVARLVLFLPCAAEGPHPGPIPQLSNDLLTYLHVLIDLFDTHFVVKSCCKLHCYVVSFHCYVNNITMKKK